MLYVVVVVLSFVDAVVGCDIKKGPNTFYKPVESDFISLVLHEKIKRHADACIYAKNQYTGDGSAQPARALLIWVLDGSTLQTLRVLDGSTLQTLWAEFSI